jgi:hypothetical protein
VQMNINICDTLEPLMYTITREVNHLVNTHLPSCR